MEAADFEVLQCIWDACWPHHPLSISELAHDLETLSPDRRPQYWLAKHESAPIGYLELSWDIGSYDPTRLQISIGVIAEARRQGVGCFMYNHALSYLSDIGAKQLITRTAEDDSDSIEFLQKRGFQQIKRDFESTLDLEHVADQVHSWLPPDGVRIVEAKAIDSPTFREEFHALFERVRVDVPRSAPPTPLEFAEFEKLVLDAPDLIFECLIFAVDQNDRLIGFTGGHQHPSERTFQQWLTAVHPDWRGTGIAKALKAALIPRLLSLGFSSVRTDNDSRNAGMLGINRAMGFKALPAMVSLLKRLD